MRPRIGITCGSGGVQVSQGILPSHYLGVGYPRAVWAAGGTPVPLPALAGHEGEAAAAYVEEIDGLVLAGGTDIHPQSYGQSLDPERTRHPDLSRDRFEAALLGLAAERGIPVLGICRGFQLINVAAGGTLDQHRPHAAGDLADVDGLRVESTELSVEPGSRLERLLGSRHISVYCMHHQAVAELGDGLRAVARSADGLIEAIEGDGDRFLLGVLWHPEQMLDEASSLLPYRALVSACTTGGVTRG